MNIDYIALGKELLEFSRINDNYNHERTIQEFFFHKQKEQDLKVVQLGATRANTGDSRDWDVRKALFDIINDKEFPISVYSKMIVFQLSELDDRYDIRYKNVGMKNSECVSLVEVGKNLLISEMGL